MISQELGHVFLGYVTVVVVVALLETSHKLFEVAVREGVILFAESLKIDCDIAWSVNVVVGPLVEGSNALEEVLDHAPFVLETEACKAIYDLPNAQLRLHSNRSIVLCDFQEAQLRVVRGSSKVPELGLDLTKCRDRLLFLLTI